jgi:hypothetical protein
VRLATAQADGRTDRLEAFPKMLVVHTQSNSLLLFPPVRAGIGFVRSDSSFSSIASTGPSVNELEEWNGTQQQIPYSGGTVAFIPAYKDHNMRIFFLFLLFLPYTISADGKAPVFISESIEISSHDEVTETFSLAPPDKPFEQYTRVTLKKARQTVGTHLLPAA